MAYLVLARKYRPKNFGEVVHQEHVTTTLKNAIAMNRVAHAHIFTGPRGTGKTTIARILAKCMNCADASTDTPCGECISCSEINSGNASDIIEIDGASNNSVDQIREIRDNLQYKPSHSKFKIYIIDEVHMLSIAAFNALLKSLEEPPSHVMFYFATTEPHKVPVTIMSRCQRHDLKRVPLNILVDHLKYLCESESIEIEAEGLLNIAATAEGSVRDSMSILDQVISSATDSKIDLEHIDWILGSTPFPLIKTSLEAMFRSDAKALVEIVSKLYFSGSDLKIFYKKIIHYLRDALILKFDTNNNRLCDLPQNQKNDLIEISAPFSSHYLSRLLDLLLKEELNVRQTENIRVLLELLFVKLSQIPTSKNISEILNRIEKLETGNITLEGITLPDSITKNIPAQSNQESFKPKESITEIQDEHTDNELSPQVQEETQNLDIIEKSEEPLDKDDKKEIDLELKKAKVKTKEVNNKNRLPSNENDEQIWKKLVKEIRGSNPSIGDLLETKVKFDTIEDSTLNLIATGTKFHLSQLKKDKTKKLIEEIASNFFNKDIKINFIESKIDKSRPDNGINDNEKLLSEIKMNPLVLTIKDKLNAKIVDERIIEGKNTK